VADVNLVLMGAPGAGKGTQSAPLATRLGIPSISTGDILREQVRKKTPLGLEAKRSMDRGELVPDDVMIKVIEERLKREDCHTGFLLDGFPRTLPQAEALAKMLTRLGCALDKAISLTVPTDELVKRLSGRRTCRDCGALYHVIFDPSTNAGICNQCQGELYQRDDDQEDVIRTRLDVYDKQTAPVLDWYRSRGLLAEVDGLGGRDEVQGRILKGLGVTP
jgi:adenylate kinase